MRTLTSAVGSNCTLNMAVYSTSTFPNYNLSAAYSVILTLATCALFVFFLKLTQKRALG